jgi:hypothetical protein
MGADGPAGLRPDKKHFNRNKREKLRRTQATSTAL